MSCCGCSPPCWCILAPISMLPFWAYWNLKIATWLPTFKHVLVGNLDMKFALHFTSNFLTIRPSCPKIIPNIHFFSMANTFALEKWWTSSWTNFFIAPLSTKIVFTKIKTNHVHILHVMDNEEHSCQAKIDTLNFGQTMLTNKGWLLHRDLRYVVKLNICVRSPPLPT